jgi:hypothetical protein
MTKIAIYDDLGECVISEDDITELALVEIIDIIVRDIEYSRPLSANELNYLTRFLDPG